MLVKPFIGAAASGKVGGLVASHNGAGQYFRAFVIPTNPRTANQSAVRTVFGGLAAAWTNTLTQAQRDAWTAYGQATTVRNRLGDQIHLAGLPSYQRLNGARVQAGLPRVDDPPSPFALAPTSLSLQPFSNFVAGPPSTLDFAFDNSDTWATAVGGGCMIYASPPKNITVNFYKGKFNLAAAIPGAVVPPTTPATFTLPTPAVAGQRIFLRVVTSTAGGSLSQANFFQFDT